VITEDNIWNASHTEGERIEVDRDSKPQAPPPGGDRGTEAEKKKTLYEYGDIQMKTADQGETPGGEAQSPQQEGAPSATQTLPRPESEKPVEQPAGGSGTGDEEYDMSADAESGTESDSTSPGPGPESSDFETKMSAISGSPKHIQVSAILGDSESSDGDTEEDHRSHYDLGMAYLEMDLLAEAIREYQFASKSPKYQARALEMIGLCFLKQNQASLAIKQLNKGLQAVGDNTAEALGIKYNLGLAYEMAGDTDKARSAFEDVYVEDVTFRDVAKKIEQLS
jgi:tetratricopeptide (TPR) repeat protein